MQLFNPIGPSPYDSDSDVEEILKKYDFYIRSLARQAVLRSFPVHQDVLDLEIDEVAQSSRIKLWRQLQKQPITHLRAYIRCLVHNESVNLIRQVRPSLYQALPIDEDGEIQEGNLVVIPGAELGDPETILEEKEAVEELLSELVDVVSELRPRQMHSTICTLKDRVDDLFQFVDALKEKGIESELQWPFGTIERQRLQASYSPAKRKVASYIGVDLSLYK